MRGRKAIKLHQFIAQRLETMSNCEGLLYIKFDESMDSFSLAKVEESVYARIYR